MHKNICIIGGGISGLTALYYLRKKGLKATLFEVSSQIGGVIQTKNIDNFIIEKGPNTMLLSDQRTLDMIKDLELSIENASPYSNKRYVVKNRKCLSLPISIFNFITTSLFSFPTKFKILIEVFKRNKKSSNEESISQFFIRRFGKEFLDYAINPFIAGTYAGDPDILSIKYAFPKLYELESKYGSVIGGLFKEKKDINKIKRQTISFNGGINTFTQKLAKRYKESIFTKSQVKDISKHKDGYTITLKQNNELKTLNYDNVICTIPAYSLKKITVNGRSFKDFTTLNKINYPSIISISLGYNSESIPHNLSGFGVLVPKCENMNILGILFSSSLFKNRAPKGKSLLTIFMGGSRHPEHCKLSKEERYSLIYKDLEKLLGIKSKPIFNYETIWEKSIPQYHLGYGHYNKILGIIELKLPGFYFAGNFVNGISIQDTILNSMNLINEKF